MRHYAIHHKNIQKHVFNITAKKSLDAPVLDHFKESSDTYCVPAAGKESLGCAWVLLDEKELYALKRLIGTKIVNKATLKN